MSEPKERPHRKIGTFDVSLELLAQLLHLPETDKIVHVEYKFHPPLIKITIEGGEGSTLPIAYECAEVQKVCPVYHKEYIGEKVTFVKY